MHKFLCVYFVIKHNFLFFFLCFCIRYPKIVISEVAKRAVSGGRNQGDRSRDSLILSDHGPVPLISWVPIEEFSLA